MARKDGKDRGLFERPKGVWWIRYNDSEGKEHREKCGLKRTALATYNLRRAAILKGEKLPEKVKRKVSFATITEEALLRSKARKASWQDDEERSRPLLAAFGERAAESIQPSDIEGWMDSYKSRHKLQPATLNRYRALMSMIYNHALKNGRVKDNPVRRTDPLPVQNERVRFLSEEERTRLQKSLTPEQEEEVLFAMLTGVRQGDQFSLRWNDVDLGRGTAFFPKTKNGDSRYVHLNSTLKEILTKRPRDSEYVFPISREALKTAKRLCWFETALRRAGIEDFRWHDLRHTFASKLAMKGHSMRTLQEALGHKTPQMSKRYSHLSEEHMKNVVEDLA